MAGATEMMGKVKAARGPEELATLVRELGRQAEQPRPAGAPSIAAELIDLLMEYTRHPDYLVCSTAFAALRRIARGVQVAGGEPPPWWDRVVAAMMEFLSSEKEPEFRLRSLDVLAASGDQALVDMLAPFLADRDPLVVKGVVWAIGHIGGERAVEVLVERGSTPAGRLVRREIWGEALGLALARVPDPLGALEQMSRSSRKYRHFLEGLCLEVDYPRYSVYPAPDYFRLQCAERGLDYRKFKYLTE